MFSWFKKKSIKSLLTEKRPLPIGMAEFDEWSDRIISGTCLPATSQSQKFALAEMIMHLPPTDDCMDDLFFIKKLRKGAVNQIAYAKMESIRDAEKKRLKEIEDAKKATLSVVPNQSAEATAQSTSVADGPKQ